MFLEYFSGCPLTSPIFPCYCFTHVHFVRCHFVQTINESFDYSVLASLPDKPRIDTILRRERTSGEQIKQMVEFLNIYVPKCIEATAVVFKDSQYFKMSEYCSMNTNEKTGVPKIWLLWMIDIYVQGDPNRNF